jgi:large subunit ribosomal protein L4
VNDKEKTKTKTKTLELPDSIFNVEKDTSTLHSVIKTYRSNRRQGTHATKTRSSISGGGKKPLKQKGTGSARQGSSRSPLMEGGAISHGPQPRDYRQSVNKKVKKLALRLALSAKAKKESIKLIEDPVFESFSTKKAIKYLDSCGWKKEKITLVLGSEQNPYLLKSFANIKNASVSAQKEINAESVLRSSTILLTKTALKDLEQRLGSEIKG